MRANVTLFGGMSESRPRPIAQGYLSDTPFQHLLMYLARHGYNGTLVAMRSEQEGETRIRFRAGRPVAARFPRSVSLTRGLLPMCSWPEASFAFFPADLVGRGLGVTKGLIEPAELISASLDEHTPDALVPPVLARLQGVELVRNPKLDASSLRLRSGAQALLRRAEQGPASADALLAVCDEPEPLPQRVLYMLVITGLLISQETADQEQAAQERARRLSERRTLRDRPLTPPPDMEPAAESGRPSTPAWKRLASMRPSMRPGPLNGSSAISFKPAEAAPEHEVKLREAVRLEKAGLLEQALEAIKAALELEQEQARYHAVHAGILLQLCSEGEEPQEVKDALKRALELDEEEPTALYVKGLSYKRRGKMREAYHYFKQVVAAKPTHIEAKRELRLLRMRRDTWA